MKKTRSSIKKPAAGWFIMLFFIGCLYANDAYFEIVAPANKSIYNSDSASVVIKTKNSSLDRVEISSSNNEIISEEKITPEKKSYCATVTLHYGENRIKTAVYKDDKKLAESFVSVYYASPVYRGFKYPPGDFKARAFHTEKNDKECAKCHNMASNEKKGAAFADVTKSNCYVCHKSITSKKYAHAPAVNWLCTSCHDNSAGVSRFGHPESINQSCYLCHEKNRKEWMSRRFFHEPFDAGRCIRCHDPHSSEEHIFLRMPVNRLCTSCHADKSRPAEERNGSQCPGSSKPSCVECHDPHASDRGFFLIEKKGQ